MSGRCQWCDCVIGRLDLMCTACSQAMREECDREEAEQARMEGLEWYGDRLGDLRHDR